MQAEVQAWVTKVQVAWKKGLAAALGQAGAMAWVYFVDEMRVGLQGQMRLRWGGVGTG